MGWSPFGWLARFEVDTKAERRIANRPHRGDRAKVKAGRKAARVSRGKR